MQEPVAVLVDRGPVAVHPDPGKPAPVRVEVPLRVAPEPARHPGERLAADELADLAAHASALGVDDVHRHPERGPAERARLDRHRRRRREEARADLGAARAVDDRAAPAADRSWSQRYGSGFHGSPVVTIVAQRREVGARGSPCGISARMSVGESPSIVTRSARPAARAGPAASRARPRRRRSCAERAAADDGPRAHDPAHVGREVDDVAGADVGLVADLARDRDEEAALDVDHALRLAGRAGRVREQVRRSDRPRAAGSSPGRVGDELVPRRDDDVLDATAPRAAPPRGSRASAPRARGATSVGAVIATFASRAWSRCATAGAANPEKIGTWIAPMCAHACEATATSGDIGRKIATRSPGSTPSPTSASASRVTSRESSRERERRAARRPRRARRPRPRRAVARAQRWTQFQAMLSLPADEPRRPLGPAREVARPRPTARELEPDVLDRDAARTSRVLLRARGRARRSRRTRAPHEPRRVRALELLRRRPPDRPRSRATYRAYSSCCVANLVRANLRTEGETHEGADPRSRRTGSGGRSRRSRSGCS